LPQDRWFCFGENHHLMARWRCCRGAGQYSYLMPL
jgi:hypothetical protein